MHSLHKLVSILQITNTQGGQQNLWLGASKGHTMCLPSPFLATTGLVSLRACRVLSPAPVLSGTQKALPSSHLCHHTVGS